MKGRRLIKTLGIAAAGLIVAVAVALIVRPSLYHRLMAKLSGTPVTSSLNVKPDREKFPVRGLDISHHNGNIDFKQVAADSIDFVYIKATEGADHTDSRWLDHCKSAREAGIAIGFYHFFRFDRGGVKQGRHFLNTTQQMPSQLPMAIDFEQHGNPDNVDYYRIVGRLRDMIAYLKRHERRVIIYCNSNDYERYIRGNFDDIDLWMATEREPEAGDRRKLWQHSHTGKIPGINKPVDINTFNGTRDEFRQWMTAAYPSAAAQRQHAPAKQTAADANTIKQPSAR